VEPVARLVLDGVSKRFGEVQALAPVSLEIVRGEFVGILGPSGCGKTTLLRCLAGLETPDRGRIAFDDRDVFDADRRLHEPPHKRGIGMVFQDLALWPHLTVFENVAYTLRARKDRTDLRERVHEALAKVQLPTQADRYPHQLSGGQQQRVAFARAVVDRPAVLLMDEPLSALDAALRIDLRAELTAITKQLGLTAVYVTHDQHEAMSMADRILVMEDGHVRQDGAPETIYQRPMTRFVADFIGRLNPFDRAPDDLVATGETATAHTASANGAAAGNGDGSARLSSTGALKPTGVRPEKVRLVANGGGEMALPAEVELASYLGDRYELRCRLSVADEPWVVYSDRRHEVGEQLLLHVTHDDLIVTTR
jgi:iron(III) transport system ATP-binding protein